ATSMPPEERCASSREMRVAVFITTLLRRLGREYVGGLDVEWCGEQLVRPCDERRGNGSLEMGAPAFVVGESVHDGERRLACSEGKPGNRLGLVLDERQCVAEKGGELFFFAGLCFESNDQGFGDHASEATERR